MNKVNENKINKSMNVKMNAFSADWVEIERGCFTTG